MKQVLYIGLSIFVAGSSPVLAGNFMEDYFEESNFYNFGISPEGRHVSYMERAGPIYTLHVRDFEKDRGYSLECERDAVFLDYAWVDEDTIALHEFIADRNQFPRSYISTYSARLRRKNADFNRPSRLTMEIRHRDIMPTIVSGVPGVPDIFLVAEPTVSFLRNPGRIRNDFDSARSYVHRIHVGDRRVEKIVDDPSYDAWIADSQGRLRLALRIFGEEEGVYYRENDRAEWHRLPLPEDAVAFGFLRGDENILVAYQPEDEDRIVVQAYDVVKRAWSSKPIGDPDYDVTTGGGEWPTPLMDTSTGSIIGIQYDRDKPRSLWFDPSYAQVQKMVETVFPDSVVRLYGLVKPLNSVLLEVRSDLVPGEVLFFDLETKELKRFMTLQPSVKDYEFRKIQPVRFTARDGANIHAYLTLPEGSSKENPPPLAVVVKGGPMGRTSWADGLFFFESQWLSGLGFSVLQVDYRGSTGYGKLYEGDLWLHAAEKGVEDVVDATRWAIENGHADPRRIVLMGASFGGYVSGMAPAVEPDLFTITLPAMGVYDWLEMFDYDKRISHPFIWEQLKERVGDLEELADDYRQWSAVEHADKIRIPVLLMHGVYDQRVDLEQAKLFESALRKGGVNFETYTYTRGGHGFGEQEGWVDYFEQVESFIRKHIQLP